MSAREKLIRLARENMPDYGNHVPCDPETGFMFMGEDEYIAHVGKLLDECVHELTEELREWAAEAYPDDGEPQEFYGNWGSFYRDAADFIDPEVAEGVDEDAEDSAEPTP